jgi:hypothetical protein
VQFYASVKPFNWQDYKSITDVTTENGANGYTRYLSGNFTTINGQMLQ